MKQLLVFLLLLCSASVSAQDVIVKKDGSTILSKVLEVNTADVKYKKFSNPEGPTYTISKSEIMAINYENGEKDSFDEISQTNDSKGSTPSFITTVADQRNSTLTSWYNKHYSPTEKMKKGGKTENYMLIFWLSPSSIISNDDIEVTLERNVSWQESGEKGKGGWWQQLYYTIKITNKSDRIIYVDKGNCFRNENNRLMKHKMEKKCISKIKSIFSNQNFFKYFTDKSTTIYIIFFISYFMYAYYLY